MAIEDMPRVRREGDTVKIAYNKEGRYNINHDIL